MDIESLIGIASDTMLTAGNVMPMAHIELKSNDPEKEDIHLVLALDLFSNAQSIPTQGGIIARVGWEQCKEYPGYSPIYAGIYAEVWRITDPENDAEKLRPKLSSKRQEALIVEMWHAEGNKCESYRLPVIRDKKKRVVDIGKAEGPSHKVSVLFGSFLRGIHDSQKPDDETISDLEDMISKRVANLSPEQRQELIAFAKSEGMPEDLLNNLIGE
ncbi:MAG TPA: hypothetical protein VHV10_02890 [Ktedonobacteraceae bacterium]|nr:hypothetical protein [Ktedonobacteraceae bacterium]